MELVGQLLSIPAWCESHVVLDIVVVLRSHLLLFHPHRPALSLPCLSLFVCTHVVKLCPQTKTLLLD